MPIRDTRIFFIRFLLPLSWVIIFMASCKEKKQDMPAAGALKPPSPGVEAHIVRLDSFAEVLQVPGTLLANEATEIHPEMAGRLVSLNIREGAPVAEGALLAKLYDGDLQAQLKKLQVQLQVQEQTVKRYDELLKINGVSQQEFDLIVLQTNNLKADIELVRSNIRRTEIRAPFSGTLGLKMVSPGAYVSPQTILTSIRQNQSLKLDFTLPERYSSRLKAGMLVAFTTEGNPKLYHASMIATETAVTEDNRSLKVRCRVMNADAQVIPGRFAKIQIQFDPDPAAILIPSQAVIPQARGKKVALLKNGLVEFQDVETTARDSARVLVNEGLKKGDTIILTGLMGLKPGSSVKISRLVP